MPTPFIKDSSRMVNLMGRGDTRIKKQIRHMRVCTKMGKRMEKGNIISAAPSTWKVSGCRAKNRAYLGRCKKIGMEFLNTKEMYYLRTTFGRIFLQTSRIKCDLYNR